MRKTKLFGVSLALFGVAMVVVVHFQKMVIVQTPLVRSNYSVVPSNEISQVCDSWLQYDGELSIGGSVSFEQQSSHQNVFQTSDLNDGIRMEIDTNNQVAVIFGDHLTKGIKGVVLGQSDRSENNKLSFTFQITIFKDRMKTVFNGDQKTVFIKENILCDKAQVGSGYDKSRQLLGSAVIQFQLRYRDDLMSNDYNTILQHTGQALIMSGAFIVSGFSRRRETLEFEDLF